MPFNSTICLRNGPKRRQEARKTCAPRTNTPKPSTGCILGYVAQIQIASGRRACRWTAWKKTTHQKKK